MSGFSKITWRAPLVLALAAFAASAVAAAHASQSTVTTGSQRTLAHAARSIDGTDTGRLHLVRQHETVLYEEGTTSGVLAGHMRATLTVGLVFRGTCTIYTSHGSINASGVASPRGNGRYQSFSGTLSITGGTGLYRHIHGRTRLYGTFDRRTFGVVVQTVGRLSY